jgi:hypothetical protein
MDVQGRDYQQQQGHLQYLAVGLDSGKSLDGLGYRIVRVSTLIVSLNN